MLGHEVMMPADLLMGLAGQNLYDSVEWVKIQAEVIPMIYELVRKNFSIWSRWKCASAMRHGDGASSVKEL